MPPVGFEPMNSLLERAKTIHALGLAATVIGPIIITITKSRRVRWLGHVERMREKRNEYRLLVGKS
jgi:hypothetical protein